MSTKPQSQAKQRPEPTPARYSYLVIDAAVCYAHFGPSDPQAYLSMDGQKKLLLIALKDGYRWVRTEDGNAIWEKRWDNVSNPDN